MKLIPKLSLLCALTLPITARAQEARYFRIAGPVAASIQSLTADGFLTWTNAATDATFTVQTALSLTAPVNWVDYVQVPVTNTATIHRLFDPNSPAGMVLISAGSFTMGDTFGDWPPEWGVNLEIPAHSVYVSGFNMDRTEVTKALWDDVYQWAITHGYSFDNPGLGKGANHPVQTVNWYDVVKWCNARSEKEGRVPAYYTSAAQTTVYRTGRVGVQNGWVRWDRGYRLPTEAEWEKAARGGAGGRRFPWGDTITHSQANYNSSSSDAYDISPTRHFHPSYANGGYPYTSPVGSFGANGYGLYDMAGNVWECCWDWYGSYSAGNVSDPRGPTAGSYRVFRGGSWNLSALACRPAGRASDLPDFRYAGDGFRSVLPPGQ